jgi:TonB family protein
MKTKRKMALALVAVLAAGCAAMYGPVEEVRPGSPVRKESWRFRDPVTVGPGDTVERPVILQRAQPRYTEEARKQRISGLVELAVSIDEKGTVTDVAVVQPLEPGLDAAAVAAARQLVFSPARLNGAARASVYDFTVNFQVK